MNKSVSRQFWRYTIPTVAAMLVNGLYQVVDGIFIGRYVGAEGLAAINVAWPIIGTILGVGMMIGVGTGALVSIKQGEKDQPAAKRVLATGFVLLAGITPIVAMILFCFSDYFLVWQGAVGTIYDLGNEYLTVLIYSCVFSLGSIAIPFLLRNDGSPNFATLLMVIGAVANIIFDYLFIAWLGWALEGAAIATAISQMIVTVIGLVYFFSRHSSLRLKASDLRLEFGSVHKIVFIGASSFFMYCYGSVMIALHNSLFSYYGSPIMMGSYAILGYIVTVYYLTAEGVANGMQPLVSYNHGAGNKDNIRILLRIAMVTSVTIGIAFVLVMNVFPREFVSIFNSTNDTLIDGAITGIRLHMFALFLDGFLVVAGAYYQSVNKGSKAMFVTVGNMLVQLPFLYILPKVMGIPGIWLAFPLSNIALSIVVGWMLWKDVKRSLYSPSALRA